jgi:hypothetical protein
MPFFANPRVFEFLGLLFWIWMIYHCATREPNSLQKFLWLLFVILIPDIGALVYFFMRVVRIRG